MAKNIYRVVLTGGPCAGKTTALSLLTDRLQGLGYRVYRVPEAATLVFNGGVERTDLEDEYYTFGFQEQLMKTQLLLEKRFHKLAKDIQKPAVIICDRGLMDCKAFIKPHLWQAVLDHNEWSEIGLRDKYYDAVIHLETAAIGAIEHYTLDNNKARAETPEEAIEIDHRLKAAWTGHPHFRVVDNSTDFEQKIERALTAISRVVGTPEPIEIERKFLVKKVDEFPVPYNSFEIEQSYVYLKDGSKFRLRRRGINGNYIYTHTIKKNAGPAKRIEIEKRLTAREYLSLFQDSSITEVNSLRKIRTCFLWKNKYFELDTFAKPKGLIFLEIELDDENEQVEFPPFIHIEKEVTDDSGFSNSSIARKINKK